MFSYKRKISTFTFVILLSSLSVASIAAWFSVFGIVSLFQGGDNILWMAIFLESAKLVLISYTHREWLNSSFFEKCISLTFIITLMLITSGGIYGYLISAYQKSGLDLKRLMSSMKRVETSIDFIEKDRQRYIDEKENLRNLLTQRTSNLSKSDSSTYLIANMQSRRISESLNPQIKEAESNIVRLTSELDSLYTVKTGLDSIVISSGVDVGPLIIIADIVTDDGDMDEAIHWIVLGIVLVFDPVAVWLLFAYNKRRLREIREYDEREAKSDISDDSDVDDPLDPAKTSNNDAVVEDIGDVIESPEIEESISSNVISEEEGDVAEIDDQVYNDDDEDEQVISDDVPIDDDDINDNDAEDLTDTHIITSEMNDIIKSVIDNQEISDSEEWKSSQVKSNVIDSDDDSDESVESFMEEKALKPDEKNVTEKKPAFEHTKHGIRSN